MMRIEALVSVKRIAEVAPECLVKIAYDVEENIMFEKALRWPWWKHRSQNRRKRKRIGEWRSRSYHGGRDYDLTIWGRRAHYGYGYSTAVQLADSLSYGRIP